MKPIGPPGLRAAIGESPALGPPVPRPLAHSVPLPAPTGVGSWRLGLHAPGALQADAGPALDAAPAAWLWAQLRTSVQAALPEAVLPPETGFAPPQARLLAAEAFERLKALGLPAAPEGAA